jgi:predicted nucleic acid-binding protein
MARSLPEVHVIARDPQDNTIVACALATHAHYIVTRDKDLLDLQSYQGIRILSPERFLTLLRQPRGEQSPDQSP